MKRASSVLIPLIFLLLGAWAVCPAHAGDHPINARGFEADQVYDVGDFESVNLLNGNLTLALPIGSTYPVNADMSYGLTLVYNSSFWDHVVECKSINQISQFHWTPTYVDYGDGCGLLGHPNPGSNAGTGWTVNLGRLYSPYDGTSQSNGPHDLPNYTHQWVYVGPDGAVHAFSQRLHAGHPASTDPDTLYTRDGSYLRLTGVGSASSPKKVHFPDGSVHTFAAQPVIDRPQRHRLLSVRDTFGNGYTIGYSDPSGQHLWTLTDDHGRQQKIYFDIGSWDNATRRIDRIELEGVGGTVRTYEFEYEPTLLATPGGCPQDLRDDNGNPRMAELLLLSGIVFPDGQTRFDFEYYDSEAGALCSERAGKLKTVTLPTLGKHQYEYDGYGFPRTVCEPIWTQSGPPALANLDYVVTNGVSKRTVTDRNGNVLGTRTYEGSAAAHWGGVEEVDPGACNLPKATYTDLVEPLDGGRVKVSRHHFSIYKNGIDPDEDGWRIEEYGLPFTRAVTDGAGSATAAPFSDSRFSAERFLSTEIFECPGPAARPNGPTQDGWGDCGAPVRRTFVRYQDSAFSCGGVDDRECQHQNRRKVEETVLDRTEFALGPAREHWTFTGSTEFDGLGNHRLRISRSDVPGDVLRAVRTDWNSGGGELAPDGTGTFTVPPPSEPWVLGRYAFEKIEDFEIDEGMDPSEYTLLSRGRTDHLFDNRGFLEQTRVRINPATTSTKDLRTVYEEDDSGNGNVVREESFGGDRQVGSAPQYCMARSYASGAVKREAWLDGCAAGAAELLVTTDQTIDAATGLAVSSRDSAGVETTYSYDSLLRLTRAQTEGEAASVYTYTPADPFSGDGATATAERVGTAGTLTRTEYVYDDLGRVEEHLTLLPDGKESLVTTEYHPSGHLRSVSTAHEDGTSNPWGTVHSDYDVFGQARTVTAPDGSRTRFTFEGSYVEHRKRWVETEAGEVSTTTFTTRDHQGRIVSVGEPSGADGAYATTNYSYDFGGRLTEVRAGEQTRTFAYDGAGLLRSASQPEFDLPLELGEYDALGNAGLRRYGAAGADPNWVRSHRDAAGRVIREVGAGGTLREFSFARTNAAGQNNRGKLVRAERHQGGAVVSELFQYAGTGGRLSERRLVTGGQGYVPRVSFRSTFTYDELGNVASIAYPACERGDCAGVGPARTVRFTHDAGLLSTVRIDGQSTIAGTFAYHPNGVLATIIHGNRVSEFHEIDPERMRRARRIFTLGVGSGDWDSGDFAYDPSANVKAIGTDVFQYDRVGRLTSGQVTVNGIQYQQAASYDRHGNLTGLTTGRVDSQVDILLDPNPLTNRLGRLVYDARGNVTDDGDFTLSRDPFNLPVEKSGTTEVERYLYTADGERIALLRQGSSLDPLGETTAELWTLRGAAGTDVLRDLERQDHTGWKWKKDYVRRGSGRILASLGPDGSGGEELRHYHLDHLGSTRLVTDGFGNRVAELGTYPFGEEVPSSDASDERFRFTGHERDEGAAGDFTDDLDYMHARYYKPHLARFLAVDPVEGDPERPQSWNRYAYVINQPLDLVDPTGMTAEELGDTDDSQDLAGDQVSLTGVNPCEEPGGFLSDFVGGVLEDLGTINLSVVGAIFPKPALAGLGLHGNFAARSDGSSDLFIGISGGLGTLADLSFTGGIGSFVAVNPENRPGGWTARAKVGVAHAVGLQGTGIVSQDGNTGNIGPSIGMGATASASVGYTFHLTDAYRSPYIDENCP